MRINNAVVYDGYAVADFTTDPYDMSHMTGFSCTATLSGGGSPTGSMKLQGSNDWGKNGSTQSTWFNITLPVTSVVAITGDGSTTWNYANTYYKWIRVVYTSTGGDADVVVVFNSKGF